MGKVGGEVVVWWERVVGQNQNCSQRLDRHSSCNGEAYNILQ